MTWYLFSFLILLQEAFKLILMICLSSICDAANILYVIPFTSKSHNFMLKPIGLELARRGHNVTVITAHKEKYPPPTYRQVMVDDKLIWDVLGKKIFRYFLN